MLDWFRRLSEGLQGLIVAGALGVAALITALLIKSLV